MIRMGWNLCSRINDLQISSDAGGVRRLAASPQERGRWRDVRCHASLPRLMSTSQHLSHNLAGLDFGGSRHVKSLSQAGWARGGALRDVLGYTPRPAGYLPHRV